ncbi:hypothetical protein [Saccharothrix sp. HUAS TT1]|uniref:hypothetical protein n=1 Tax=unclassified Saccharothrix TaxID=2593673 RepID=UPI00345C36DF
MDESVGRDVRDAVCAAFGVTRAQVEDGAVGEAGRPDGCTAASTSLLARLDLVPGASGFAYEELPDHPGPGGVGRATR